MLLRLGRQATECGVKAADSRAPLIAPGLGLLQPSLAASAWCWGSWIPSLGSGGAGAARLGPGWEASLSLSLPRNFFPELSWVSDAQPPSDGHWVAAKLAPGRLLGSLSPWGTASGEGRGCPPLPSQRPTPAPQQRPSAGGCLIRGRSSGAGVRCGGKRSPHTGQQPGGFQGRSTGRGLGRWVPGLA